MPTLKQLTCQIEWTGADVPLKEYGTAYSDGFVQTYVAIPAVSTPTPFSIHLFSKGYIAPGLAMFVYMDGTYQCNRNQHGLKLPSEASTPAASEIDFRVRQKESKREDGTYLGKEWRFEKLNVVDGDTQHLADLTPSRFDHIGTIEVVVLRCQSAASNHAAKADWKKTEVAGSSRSIKSTTSTKRSKEKVEAPRPPSPMGSLFDGPGESLVYRAGHEWGQHDVGSRSSTGKRGNKEVGLSTQLCNECSPHPPSDRIPLAFRTPAMWSDGTSEPRPSDSGAHNDSAGDYGTVPPVTPAVLIQVGTGTYRPPIRSSHGHMEERGNPQRRSDVGGAIQDWSFTKVTSQSGEDARRATTSKAGSEAGHTHVGPRHKSQEWGWSTASAGDNTKNQQSPNDQWNAGEQPSWGDPDPSRQNWDKRSIKAHPNTMQHEQSGGSGTAGDWDQRSRKSHKTSGQNWGLGEWDGRSKKSHKTAQEPAHWGEVDKPGRGWDEQSKKSHTSNQNGPPWKYDNSGNGWDNQSKKASSRRNAHPADGWGARGSQRSMKGGSISGAHDNQRQASAEANKSHAGDWSGATADDANAWNSGVAATWNQEWESAAGDNTQSMPSGCQRNLGGNDEAAGSGRPDFGDIGKDMWGRGRRSPQAHWGTEQRESRHGDQSAGGGHERGKGDVSSGMIGATGTGGGAAGQDPDKLSNQNWGLAGTGCEQDSTSNAAQAKDSQLSQEQAGLSSSQPRQAAREEFSAVRPYWSKWNLPPPPAAADEVPGRPKRARGAFIADEEPLYAVPKDVADQKLASHQVQAGPAAVYVHRHHRPSYIDSLESPYAVFVFKYRSREVLGRMLNMTITDDPEDEKRRLRTLSKEEIIEELLKAKVVLHCPETARP